MGYYDTRIRREEPRSRVTRRSTNRNAWATSQNFSRSEHADISYVRRSGRKRGDYILPLSIAFGVFCCISMIALVSLIMQSFKPAKAQSQAGGKEDAGSAVPLPAMLTEEMKILLLGSDQRPEDGSYRTDVVILVVVKPAEMTVSAISFPRDLWVEVPGLYPMKINMVHGVGGFEALQTMFEASFGVKPDYYLMTNFNGFTQFIDNRGGIDVEVGQELTDDCDLPQARDGDCTVLPGTVHMDGATALWYVRSRNTSSDYDRLRRAQEVVLAAVKKMINLRTMGQFAKIKEELGSNVETNLSPQKAVSLLPFAIQMLESPDRVQRYVIGEDLAQPSWSWDGMWILLPDLDAIRGMLREAGID